jgi:hypothetical protein
LTNANKNTIVSGGIFIYMFYIRSMGMSRQFKILFFSLNIPEALPQPLKSRLFNHCIEFAAVDLTHKNKIFKECFISSAFTLADEVDDIFLTEQLHHIHDSTYRSLQGFAAQVKELRRYRSKGSRELVITKLDIEQAVKDYQATFKALKYDVVEETDAQRQDRHFVQQQLMNSVTQARQVTDYRYYGDHVDKTSQILQPEDVAEIRGLFTSEQKAFVDDTLARAARARQAELNRIAQAALVPPAPARNDGCAVQ